VSTHIIVLTTTGSVEEAERLGRSLVEARLAACVNVVYPVRSIYRWQGHVQADQEAMLVIKTRADLLESVSLKIREQHSYELPEVIALPILAGAADYLDWIDAETQPDTGESRVSSKAR